MTCPRGHGELLLRDADGHKVCLCCGYIRYESVLDVKQAESEVLTKSGRIRRLGSHGVRL